VTEEDSSLVKGAHWVGETLEEYWPSLLVGLSAVGWVFGKDFVAKPPIVPPPETWAHIALRILVFTVLTAGALGGAIGVYKRSGLVRSLKEEKRLLQAELDGFRERFADVTSHAREAWRLRLADVFTEMGLDESFRVNLYRFSRQAGAFSMIGRYSRIEQYNRMGRGVYPAHIGCIGAAWDGPSREAWIDDLPPADDPTYVPVMCDRWGFDEETVRGLTMKSRSVYAFVIMDRRGWDPIAVFVLESLRPNAADATHLRGMVTGRVREQILKDLDALSFIEPSLDLAKQEGY
jgi:hypothetical protein